MSPTESVKAEPRFKRILRGLYEGDTPRAHRFRYGLMAVEIITLSFLIVSTFYYGDPVIEALDIVFGLYVAADYLARLYIDRHRVRFIFHPLNLADLVVIISLLAPLMGENLAFLRAIRALRLLRAHRMISRLRKDFRFFREQEEIILSATNLLLFIFVMTQVVFVTQVGLNDEINHFVDALYFTVTALTTTGFGDITLQGTRGRAVSIIIMIFGVSLFLRLIQTIFRPHKVRHECPECGLLLHDRDAVHCKHCGEGLNIRNEGLV